ncbi:MAG: hypothetical protein NC489_09075 [Ruminococcus flavefaciens]|nr:hypothetical protein [Ruminococcus flavefaciens]
MRSCADRLHQIQQDVGLTDKELKQAVREVCTPTRVDLPVLREKKSAQDKLREKVAKKSKKKRRVQLAAWYLEEYLKPEYAQKLYQKYLDYKELVEHAYEEAIAIIQLATFEVEFDVDPREAFPQKTPDDLDIPEEQWEAFEQYCDKHPLKSVRDIWKRRRKFKKSLRKKRYKLYSPRRLRMYDPYYAATALDEKEMLKSIKEIGRVNELRVQKFKEMLDGLVKDQSIGSVAMKQFSKQTDELLKQHRRRLNDFIKRTGKEKPMPVLFDWGDGPVSYDDWDNPDSIDSVLGVKIKDL